MSLRISFEDDEVTSARLHGEQIEKLAARVDALLRASDQPLCVRRIRRAIGARNEDVGAALSMLCERGKAIWMPGPSGARMWRSVGGQE